MKWFNKLSCENIASHHNNIVQQRHKRIKKTTNIPTIKCTEFQNQEYFHLSQKYMTTSLSGIDYNKIQKLDPEDFFQDPVHVKNYREEENFLNLMSEWEIIENSPQINGNYFSADFEEELLQLRTQNSQIIATVATCDDNITTITTTTTTTTTTATVNSLCKTPLSSSTSSSLCSSSYLSSLENLSLCPKDVKTLSELHLIEFLFADKIQLGIIIPKSSMCLKYLHNNDTDNNNDDNNDYDDDGNNDVKLKLKNSLRKYRKLKFQHDKKINSHQPQQFDSCYNNGAKAECAFNDCAINRSQFKTEALAGSIMGAIGKCPTQHITTIDLKKEIIKDCYYSTEKQSCGGDHYEIKKHFHLDDEGNILLNINHIEEFRGFGFAVAQNKRLYRRCLRHTQMAFDIDCCHRDCLFVMKRSLVILWNLISGEQAT